LSSVPVFCMHISLGGAFPSCAKKIVAVHARDRKRVVPHREVLARAHRLKHAYERLRRHVIVGVTCRSRRRTAKPSGERAPRRAAVSPLRALPLSAVPTPVFLERECLEENFGDLVLRRPLPWRAKNRRERRGKRISKRGFNPMSASGARERRPRHRA